MKIKYIYTHNMIWLNKFHKFHMAAVVSIVSRYDLSIDGRHRNQPFMHFLLPIMLVLCSNINSIDVKNLILLFECYIREFTI